MIKFDKGTFKPFDYFLIFGVLVSTLLYSWFTHDFDLLGFIASLTGLINVVLVARGKISNYIFGIVNVALLAYISFKSRLWGDAAINGLYFLPMQFIGWAQWNKKKTDDTTVKARHIRKKEGIILSAVCIVAIISVGFILRELNDAKPFLDAALNVLSITAMYLMVKAISEQWAIWCLINGFYMVTWLILTVNGTEHAATMLIMRTFFMANSINGYIQWNKLAK